VRIKLIHWNEKEAKERAQVLVDADYTVDRRPFAPAVLKELIADPPDAFVIDLTRLPSQGRDLAIMLRKHGSTREVPLVFVEGAPEKVEKIQKLLPDATFTTWGGIRSALKKSPKGSKKDLVVPRSVFEAYAGAPLVKKLGIKPGMTLALVNAPNDFEQTLGKLPRDVNLRKGARGRADIAIWFARSKEDLEGRMKKIAGLIDENGRLWIAWPKKASGLKSDLSQQVIRRQGLAIGLVDYKVCSIDATWSGLLFTWRKRR
jgi:hypothetical protein